MIVYQDINDFFDIKNFYSTIPKLDPLQINLHIIVTLIIKKLMVLFLTLELKLLVKITLNIIKKYIPKIVVLFWRVFLRAILSEFYIQNYEFIIYTQYL